MARLFGAGRGVRLRRGDPPHFGSGLACDAQMAERDLVAFLASAGPRERTGAAHTYFRAGVFADWSRLAFHKS